MNKALISILFLAWASFLFGQQNLNLSLQECIQYAEQHNLTLQSGSLDVNASEIQLKQAKLRQYPTVSAGIGQNFSYSHGNESFNLGGSYNLNAGVDIFKGLTIRNNIKRGELELNQAQLQVEQSKNQIRINIIQSYLTILLNQEMLEYQRNVLNTSREQVAQGAQRVKGGRILESDYKLLQAQYLSDSVNIENTLIAIDNEYVQLRNLLNTEPGQTLTIVTPDSAQLALSMQVPELATVLRQALDYLPDLKIRQNSVEIAQYDVKIAKGSYYPSISASAGIGTGYNAAYGNGNNGLTSGLYKGLGENIGLNINIPIYQQGSVHNNVQIKNLQVQQAELALKNAEADVIRQIEAYHLEVKKAFNNYQLSELQQEAYYLNYMTYSQKFQYGSITAVDLLQQQTNYLNILSQYMRNKYNFLLQKKVLEVYTGQNITL